MTQWALEHPFLTFILAMLLLMALDNAIGNFARVRIAKHLRDGAKSLTEGDANDRN